MFERFVIVAGLSGAGKSQAMKSLEDIGFYCVDNLPPAMLDEFVSIAARGGGRNVALALDVRASGALGNPLEALETLHKHDVTFELLFLEASDDAIVRRYSETRRRHPLESDGKLNDAIAREREALVPLRALADRVWDTSGFTPTTLAGRVRAAYTQDGRARKLPVNLVAFGFKYGVPKDADLVFDVRFFLNPNYVPDLKERDGRHRTVAEFMEALPETAPFLAHLFGMIDFLVPLYAGEGKSRLTIAVGCTGGRHRSVYVVDRLAQHLDGHDAIGVTRSYRELTD